MYVFGVDWCCYVLFEFRCGEEVDFVYDGYDVCVVVDWVIFDVEVNGHLLGVFFCGGVF